jgi:hypothetical protein
LLNVPPAAEALARVKSVGASLKVKVTVAVGLVVLTSLLLTARVAVGVTVSTTKAALLAALPVLPFASCQLESMLTEPFEISVPALAVKVAV